MQSKTLLSLLKLQAAWLLQMWLKSLAPACPGLCVSAWQKFHHSEKKHI